jgi:hypothetical protein
MIEGKRAVSHTSVFALRRPYGSQYAAHYQRNCTCASRVSPHSDPTSVCKNKVALLHGHVVDVARRVGVTRDQVVAVAFLQALLIVAAPTH